MSHKPINIDRILGHPRQHRTELIPVLHGTLLVLPPRIRAYRREDKMTVKVNPNDKGDAPGKSAEVLP
jgi:hypothetical protein